MSDLTLLPAGAGSGRAPQAAVAPIRTTGALVGPEEADAAYFRRLEAHGIHLNERQLLAVRHNEGPLLTLAGAGSGKTSVLICRTGYLLTVRGADPRGLLLMTFSNKAAAEMRERIVKLPGMTERTTAGLQARTFHSFFLYFLRRQGFEQEIFAEMGRQHIQLKLIMRELGLQDAYQPEALLALLSSYKVHRIAADELPERTTEEQELKAILTRYETWKTENRLLDFDDVLLEAYRLLTEQPALLRTLQRRYRYIMVDEFQDTNSLQYELVQLLAAAHRNLMVVGDDDQTIYSFNGARSEFILDFEKTYPGAKVVTLDINYRSPPAIVGLGNEIIRHNKLRRRKTLKVGGEAGAPEVAARYARPLTTDDEAKALVDRIEAEVADGKRSYGDYAVLYRAASNNRAMLEQLVSRGVPHIDYGDGRLLYEHWLIRPVLDHLRLALNRRNFEAIESVLPSMYVNRERGMAFIQMQEATQPKRGPLIHLLQMPDLKEFQVEKIRQRIEFIHTLREMRPLDAIVAVRKTFYDAFMDANERQKLTQHKEMLKELLDELETSAERFGTLQQFLQYIEDLLEKAKLSVRRRAEEQGDRVALMTIHRSKGLEFPVVMLIGASEGSLPHSSALEADKMKDLYPQPGTAIGGAAAANRSGVSKTDAAIEEERRLAYVAVTRAREELIVSSPSRYRGKKAAVSRFVLAAFGDGRQQQRQAHAAASGAFDGGRRPGSGAGGTGRAGTGSGAGGAGRAGGKGFAPGGFNGARSVGGEAAGSGGRGRSLSAERSGRVIVVPTVFKPAAKPDRPGRMETVSAWLCSSPACSAWSRIGSKHDADLASKSCPLCGKPMKKGVKEIAL